MEGELVLNFWFTNDCALNATSEAEIQQSMDQLAACANFGLIINTKKTEILHQPASPIEPSITANGKILNAVNLPWYYWLICEVI